MQIPKNDLVDAPTVSATQMRTYGAGGFRLSEQEQAKGCPRQYKAKYVERRVIDTGTSYELAYGRMIHDALYVMEEHALSPVEALDRVFPADLTPEAYAEALADLNGYLERGASPMDRFGTVAVEQDLFALLYTDEVFGPVYYRGIVDWLGVDLEVPGVLHIVDYKSNRNPPSVEDVKGDVQMKGYHWLVAQNWKKWLNNPPGRIVTHLDAIKFREVEVLYSEDDIEAWHSWAVAVVRRILRDEEALPVLNPGCAFCPVRGDCPAFAALPEAAKDVLAGKPSGSDDERLLWRDRANQTRLLLEKAVKEIDAEFADRTRTLGHVLTADWVFTTEPDWKDDWDLPRLHQALGDQTFYRIAGVSKTAVEKATKDWPASDLAEVQACRTRVPVGTKVAKRKRQKGEE